MLIRIFDGSWKKKKQKKKQYKEAPVVQTLVSTIPQTNLYPADKIRGNWLR